MGRGGRRPGARGQAKADRRDHRHAPSPRGVPALCRLGCRIHPVAAGVGDGNGAPRGARAASPAGLDRAPLRRRRAPIRRRDGECSHYSRTDVAGPRPNSPGRLASAPRSSSGMAQAGMLEQAGAGHPPPFARPDARSPGPAAFARAGGRRRRAGAGGGERRLFGDPARRRHRLRQDGGVFRRDRRRPSPRPASAGVAAGDRPFLTVAGPVQAPVRRRPCGLALGPRLPARAGSPGGRWPKETPRSWLERARHCSCRSPTSASWWWTRSTRRRSSRRTGWCTTPATSPWCAPGCRRRRRYWCRPRPAWKPSPM